MRPRPGATAIRIPNRAEPPMPVIVTIRRGFAGIMPPQCTWLCHGCRDGDDQPQALQWARKDALEHAAACRVRPAHTYEP